MAGLFGGKGGGFLSSGIPNMALMQAGLGLIGSANTNNPWSGLGPGFSAGMQYDLQQQDQKRRDELFDLKKAEAERAAAADAQWNEFLMGKSGAPASSGPGSRAMLSSSGVDPSYRPPGMPPMPPGIPNSVPAVAPPGAPGSAAAMSATGGINPTAGGGGAAGILEKLRNTPGGMMALRGMGREGGSKFLLDQLVNPTQRKMYKGADGFNYYSDTNERVNPNVKAKPEYKTVKGRGLVQMVDGKPQVVLSEGQSGAYEGTSMDAQNANVLLSGDPGTPEYAAAYNMMAQPKLQMNPSTGEIITTTPDMSAFRKPTFQGYGGTPSTPASPADPISFGGDKGGVTSSGRKRFTEAQGTSAGYANRMVESGRIMDGLEAQGLTGVPEVGELAAGAFGDTAANLARSPERQMFHQAQEDWVRAKLRKESGAVIADEEMAREIRTYFPQLGDSPEVIAQKKRARDTATQNLIKQSGGAYENKFAQSPAERAPIPVPMPAQPTPSALLTVDSPSSGIPVPDAERAAVSELIPPPEPAPEVEVPPDIQGLTRNGKQITDEQVQYTMQKYGLSRAEVVNALLERESGGRFKQKPTVP